MEVQGYYNAIIQNKIRQEFKPPVALYGSAGLPVYSISYSNCYGVGDVRSFVVNIFINKML